MECLRLLAATGEPFTADEVHDLMRPYGVHTQSENAMGAMFNKARREGLIVSDGMYRPSERRDGATFIGAWLSTDLRRERH
jgi:hypothetical protein